MKKIVVTPAGRKRYLEILYNNLKKNKIEFDYWYLWVNTNVETDIEYMKKLQSENDFIKLFYPKIPVNGNFSIYHFFKDCIDVNSVYLRLDDDIVYIHPNSIKTMFENRISNQDPFLLYGNIVNNAVISHLHQRFGILNSKKNAGFGCMDQVGWNDPEFAYSVHENFFKKYESDNLEDYYCNNWYLLDYTRVSINCICWLGKTFAEFNGDVGHDEEQWLSVDKPLSISKPNLIIGKTLFCHFSFYTQRSYLDNTDLLYRYRIISESSNKPDYIKKNEIINEILKNKLFIDNRGNLYGDKYKDYLSSETGTWQMPEELSDLLIFLSDKNIRTFLNIGTFNGITFNIISNFLYKKNKTKCITIDPFDFKPIIDEKFEYKTATSDQFMNQHFDLVFIDGDHSYNAVKKDYYNVGIFAKYCVFHDIDDDFIGYDHNTNGGVPRFWQEIKFDKKFIEFVEKDKPVKMMGIGVVYE